MPFILTKKTKVPKINALQLSQNIFALHFVFATLTLRTVRQMRNNPNHVFAWIGFAGVAHDEHFHNTVINIPANLSSCNFTKKFELNSRWFIMGYWQNFRFEIWIHLWYNILFSSSNKQFYESRISISPIKGAAKCFFFFFI